MTPSPPRWDIFLICGCALLAWGGIVGLIVYVAAHFVAKFW
jgi:hypothetical protein